MDRAVSTQSHRSRQNAGSRGGSQGAAVQRDGFGPHGHTLKVQRGAAGHGRATGRGT